MGPLILAILSAGPGADFVLECSLVVCRSVHSGEIHHQSGRSGSAMMEDGEVALNGVAEPSKDSEPTSAKSEREPTRSPGGDPSSPEHKRKRDSKEEGGSSAKRHKEHKHKKHKKHKKERKSDSSPEATHRERAVSGSRSPSPKDTSKTDDRKSNDKQIRVRHHSIPCVSMVPCS